VTMTVGLFATSDGAGRYGCACHVCRTWNSVSDSMHGMPSSSLGADGVMVPLVHSPADAARAVSCCKYPPEGSRSVAYPVRAVYKKGVGPAALGEYVKTANRETEVGGGGVVVLGGWWLWCWRSE
jgi:hypothetical protein